MMVDASVHTEDKLALLYVQKISLLLLFAAMDILLVGLNRCRIYNTYTMVTMHGFIAENHTSPSGCTLGIGCFSAINPW